jgi:hypothetical protein
MNLRKTIGIAVLVSVSVVFLGVTAASGDHLAAPHPQSGAASPHCRPVGGMIMTNFGVITPTSTLGTATGDLQGAVSATLLGAPESGAGNTVIFHVQHHFVTGSGDVIVVDPATATTVPLSATLYAVLTYPIHISGGTGKFAGATGDITNIGEVRLPSAPDTTGGTTVFRYSGQVCFAAPGND